MRGALRQAHAINANRIGHHPRSAAIGVVEVLHAAAFGNEAAVERLRDIEYRRHRHLAGQTCDPCGGGAGQQDVVEHLRDAVAIFQTRGEIGEIRVGAPFGMAEFARQRAQQFGSIDRTKFIGT